MKSIQVCEYSRSRSFHDDLILQDQASGERSQDQWSSGICMLWHALNKFSFEKAEHKFLERGHTFNENDCMHSTIETALISAQYMKQHNWLPSLRVRE